MEAPTPLLNSIPEDLLPRFDPDFIRHYNKHNVGRLATHQVTIECYRKHPEKYYIPYARGEGPEVRRVTEQQCPVEGGQITVRSYEPDFKSPPEKPVPAYINFHGGGWTFNGLSADEPWCKRVANEVGCVVFDVDYRLAPEFPYPTPLNDAWAAFKWVCVRNHV